MTSMGSVLVAAGTAAALSTSATEAAPAPLGDRLLACLDAVENRDVRVIDALGPAFFGGRETFRHGGQGTGYPVTRGYDEKLTRYSQRPTLHFTIRKLAEDAPADAFCVVYFEPSDTAGEADTAVLRAEIERRHGPATDHAPRRGAITEYQVCRENGTPLRVLTRKTEVVVTDQGFSAQPC